MALYLILAAIIFAVSAGMTFSTKTVTNQQSLICLFLFPVVYLACGLPLEALPAHIIAAAVAYVFGFILRVTVGIGGGVGRALALAVLWVPGLGLVFDYVCLALIMGGVAAVLTVVVKGRGTQRIDHFAAVMLAVCSGFLVYQFNEGLPEKGSPLEVQMTSTPSSPAPALKLRGPAE
jgi:Flp pilus assembly protein protease CpaA